MSDRPKGSGYFAAAFGIAFAALFVSSLVFDLRKICPYTFLKAWLIFSSVVLLSWGINRIKNGAPGMTVGQNTINFVFGVVGATVALLSLIASSPVCR